ncbi:MAG: hypothetical protein H6737_09730 [Alphaproteobacteria bacterium]|nr:hypothetical protein [Alphaproteobacteria bacterium]
MKLPQESDPPNPSAIAAVLVIVALRFLFLASVAVLPWGVAACLGASPLQVTLAGAAGLLAVLVSLSIRIRHRDVLEHYALHVGESLVATAKLGWVALGIAGATFIPTVGIPLALAALALTYLQASRRPFHRHDAV